MKKGIQFALITSLISGFSIFYGKIAVSHMDPLLFTTVKNGIVALILSTFILTPKVYTQLKKINRNDWLKLFSIGAIGGGIPFALFFIGLSQTTAINATMIQKTLFVWVAILAIPFLKEKLTPLQIAGYVIILGANFFIGGFKGFTVNSGELMILAATMLWAIENIIAKKTLKTISPLVVAWARMTFGLTILLAIIIFQGKFSTITSLSPVQLQIGLLSGLLLTGYVLSWYTALSKAPATLVSSVLVLSTLITNFLSVIFIDNKIPTFDTNTILILVGIALIMHMQWVTRVKADEQQDPLNK